MGIKLKRFEGVFDEQDESEVEKVKQILSKLDFMTLNCIF